MMGVMRATTPSCVCECEVVATSRDLRVLWPRLEAACQLYNAVLGDALRRLGLMRLDPTFTLAKGLPKGPARQDAFRALRELHGFREYDLHKHPSLAKDCWLRGHLDVHAAQKVATRRAFRAAERWSFGQSGKPRFKRHGELESVEGKSNAAGIRFRDGHILWPGAFGKLDLPLIVRPGNPVHAHGMGIALDGGVRHSRLLIRTILGRHLAFAQLVLAGDPLRKAKHAIGTALVGLDLGPSYLAAVTEGKALSVPFCADLDRKEAARRRFLRRLDRQRRANNPANYREGGTVLTKAQRRTWRSSVRQDATRAALAEVLRAMSAQRKSLQGELANEILAIGNRIVTERVNMRSWAKLWGRSVGHKAPGMFQACQERKATASGGIFEAVSTRATFLSSRCVCGKRQKKTLMERRHTCVCVFVPQGTHANRDGFSAFLALHCQGGTLDGDGARAAWVRWGGDCLLRSPSGTSEGANGKALPSLRVMTRQSASADHGVGQRRESIWKPAMASDGARRGIRPPIPREQHPKEVPHVA
jgi:hypothetical protein